MHDRTPVVDPPSSETASGKACEAVEEEVSDAPKTAPRKRIACGQSLPFSTSSLCTKHGTAAFGFRLIALAKQTGTNPLTSLNRSPQSGRNRCGRQGVVRMLERRLRYVQLACPIQTSTGDFGQRPRREVIGRIRNEHKQWVRSDMAKDLSDMTNTVFRRAHEHARISGHGQDTCLRSTETCPHTECGMVGGTDQS